MRVILLIVICTANADVEVSEDSKLNFTGLAIKYGQAAEEHDVITEDGYILKLFHIVGDSRRPVLLVHGLADSSDGFIIRGNISMAVNLAKNGYDVWAINSRGNRYSRRHLSLDPDKDLAFWDFNIHELGAKDLPAAIDFIQSRTKGNISIISYSEGTTDVLVLGASRPEYNDRINLFIGLAPICYLHNTKALLSTLIRFAPDINKGLRRSRAEEFFGFNSPLRSLVNVLCSLKYLGYALCIQNGLFQFVGVDETMFEPDFVPIWTGHFPAGTSRRNVNHLVQIGLSQKFARYDYGSKRNLATYGSKSPPEYDLSKVTMKVALFMGKNDKASTLEDVALLREKLPNVVEYRVMRRDSFNHVDFMWGRTTYSVVLPQIIELLRKYQG